jgi:hypothetical protein
MPFIAQSIRGGAVSALATSLALAAAVQMFATSPVSAQTGTDVIRGTVTNDSSRAIVGAIVVITRGPDRLIKQDTTDASGGFSVSFDPGTGDYLVFVRDSGYVSARRRIQRRSAEHELVADFALKSDVNRLAAINVKASRAGRAHNDVNPFQPEPGAAENWEQGVAAQIPPGLAGDLNAIAGTMSNLTMSGDGISVLGSGPESNLTTLNGSSFAAGSIPRAAQTRVRVTTATFDPTRGGFTGSNTDLQLAAGGRDYQSRRGYLTLTPSALQLTDAIGRSSGAQRSGIRGSLGADGELIRHVMTYNVAVDFGHYNSQPQTLLNAGNSVFAGAGVAPDSVSRLLGVAAPLGVAVAGHGIPTSVQSNAFTWLGRLDDSRDTLNVHALTTYASINRGGGVGLAPLSAPSTASESRGQVLGAQIELNDYVGARRRILTETRLSGSSSRNRITPYEALPAASVQILSSGIGAGTNASTIGLGGGQFTSDDQRWTLEGSNLTAWNSRSNRSTFKTQLWARLDGLRQSAMSNQFGSYSFNSLADFAAGNADSYSRTLFQPARSGTVWNAATAFAQKWAPSRRFSILYGARLEADGFTSLPARNDALESALGVRTDVAPSRLHLSPRAGFSYTYSRAPANFNSQTTSNIGSFYRSTVGVIRGGIGEFRDLLQPGMLASASALTGLPGGTSRISCVGAAVPFPDWTQFASDPATIPNSCIDGSGILADASPPVSIMSPSYDVPRSWRASLDWSSNINSWLLKAGVLGSYDLSQPSTVDVNFDGTPRFSLASEDDRPVFVSAAGIDQGSGTVSPIQSRLAPEFGRVTMRTSDLRGYGGQLTTTISPDITKFRNSYNLFTSLSYTLQASRRQYRGFDGAAFGDPRTREWAPSDRDARHIFVFSLGYSVPHAGSFTMFARAQSGLPFTPIVAGDPNGDGTWGDRAFIPDPALTPDAALASQLRSLLSNGSGTAKDCLKANLGHVAKRNGCRGPWTALLNMQWEPPFRSKWLNNRVRPSIYFENVLGGVDQLLHGGNNLHGWGSQPVIDPVLLVPRGFDPATKQFSYNVNPRFADTRTTNTLTRNPFRISIDFSIDLSVDYNLQQLRRAIEPVRTPTGWTRQSAESIIDLYLRQTSDVYKLLLTNSDSLFLSRGQIAELLQHDSVYTAQVRDVYRPLANYLAAGHGRDPGKAELDTVAKAKKAYQQIFWEQPEIAAAVLSPMQRDLITELKQMLETSREQRKHSSFLFQHPVTAKPEPDMAEPAARKPEPVIRSVRKP